MNYYIYKIENLQNHKKYIGLTNNIKRRRGRHFTDLQCNRHDNSFLQKEYNIYGKENFSFEVVFEGECTNEEISQKEIDYIKFYDSYYNGYNQNEGGNFGPSNGGSHLIKSDIFNICSALEFCSRPGGTLSEMFDISLTTVSRIKKKENHCDVIQEYENLPLEERQKIYEIFCESSDFYNKKLQKSSMKTKRQFSKQQIFIFLANEEFNIHTWRYLRKKYNIGSDYTLYCIRKGMSYQDYYLEYQQLSTEEKEKIVTLLREQ